MAGATLFSNAPVRGFIQPSDRFAPGAAGHGPVTLQLDAMISEAPDYAASPTQTQVENGSTISDHVTLKPIKLVVQGIVTDTPVGFQREFSSIFQTPSPSQAAFNFLETLWRNRIPFDFVGGLTVYTSMVITSLALTNTAETGDSLRFTCTMEQMRLVSSQTILTIKKTTQKKQSAGQQPLRDVKSPVNLQDSFQSLSPTAGTTGTIVPGGFPAAPAHPLGYITGTEVAQTKSIGVFGPPSAAGALTSPGFGGL